MRRATRTTTVQHFQGGSTGSHVRSSSDHHHSNAESFLMSFSRLKNFSGDWPSDEWGTCWRGGQAQHRQGNSHQHHIFSVFHHISYFLQLPRPIRRSPKWPSSHDYSSEYSHYDHRVWIWPLCMNMTKGLWGPNGSVLRYHIRPNVEMSDFGVLPPVVITITITRLDSSIWTKLPQLCSTYSALKSIDRS